MLLLLHDRLLLLEDVQLLLLHDVLLLLGDALQLLLRGVPRLLAGRHHVTLCRLCRYFHLRRSVPGAVPGVLDGKLPRSCCWRPLLDG